MIQDEVKTTNIEKNDYKIIPYISNYYNIIEILKQVDYNLEHAEISNIHRSLKLENENLLKEYYQERILQLPEDLNGENGNVKATHAKHLCGVDILEELITNTNVPINNNYYYNKNLTGIHANMMSLASSCSYIRFYEKVQFTTMSGWDVIKYHLLWIPSFHNKFRDILLYNKRNEIYDPNKKTSLVTLDGENYIPKQFDSYYGASSIPSIFGDVKLPNLVYHCTVATDEQIYILGGLFPCYKYDEEFPNLNDFDVHGIPNLPPPFLSQIVNHPAFIGNPFLFTVNALTSKVRLHKIKGDIPPPMIGMSGSLLTNRYIFFYGGIEIRTESSVCKQTKKITVKKEVRFNSMGYILDTVRLRFTKVSLDPLQYKGERFSDVYSRFGHLQISVKKDGDTVNESPKYHHHMHSRLDPFNKYHEFHDECHFSSPDDFHKSSYNNNSQIKLFFQPHPSHSFSATIYIFGGYKQAKYSKFQALNDMWKIHIPIHHRGKNGLCIFGETAFATCLNVTSAEMKSYSDDKTKMVIPAERGFMSYCVYNDIPGSNYSNFEIDLLENLRRNFKISLSESTAKKVLHTSNRDTFQGKPRRDESPNLSCSDYYTNFTPASNVPHPTIIMHGGSNNLDVHGDMWWFDMETELWEKVDTYVNSKQKEGKPFQEPSLLNLKLVGHTMANIGSLVSMGCGMMQSDVDTLYNVKPDDKNKEYEKVLSQGVPIGSHVFRTIDIRTQFIINRTVSFCSWDKKHAIPLTSEDPKEIHGLMLIVGSTICKSGGRYTMIGGITSRRSNLKDFYLRGTLLNITVPAVSLYG
ncbi:hypothetical protein C6P45_001060 [Maudiozyma exigua]|uniref:Uncharacterized protein n=1 Tax=Maudiozyma exigua TaxID=34358 RepID=A0A9P6W336_MAUEX|nr:hypothetical protein C6P45_001060 [Kazachstania exigua]